MASADIVVTGARVFVAPLGTTVPTATLAVGAAWPEGWRDVGFTLEPTKVDYKFDVVKIFVQQSMAPVRSRRIKEEATLETVLAEHTAGNLALAMAGIATPNTNYEEFAIGGDQSLPLMMVGMEGSYNNDAGATFPIRLICWQATAAEGGTLEYDREKPAGIPLKLDILADTTKTTGKQLFQILRVTAAV